MNKTIFLMIRSFSMFTGFGFLGLGKPDWATAFFTISIMARMDTP